jgi:hypothetical protein
MSANRDGESYPEQVVIDGSVLVDICWLLTSVEEFARFGDVEAVQELLGFAHPHLSADGLAKIAGEFKSRVRRRIEAAR